MGDACPHGPVWPGNAAVSESYKIAHSSRSDMLNRHQKCSLGSLHGTPMVSALVINATLFDDAPHPCVDAPHSPENFKKCQPVLFEMPVDCPAEHWLICAIRDSLRQTNFRRKIFQDEKFCQMLSKLRCRWKDKGGGGGRLIIIIKNVSKGNFISPKRWQMLS